jgi:hypothetical protein
MADPRRRYCRCGYHPLPMKSLDPSLRVVRLWLAFVIAGLLISGITAFPLQHEIEFIARLLNIPPHASPEQSAVFATPFSRPI